MRLHERYRTAEQIAGACPIESGLLGSLVDNECSHGRLPTDQTRRCGCWREEGAVLKVLDPPDPIDDVRPGRLSEDVALHIINLRQGGMTMPDIVIALEYFLDIGVTYNQVRHLTYGKTALRRGKRPAHATKEPKTA